MSLIDTMGKLETMLANMTKDLLKAGKGNKAAAQRVRVDTVLFEKIGKQFRKESVDAEKRKKPKKKKR
jgi:hypothetical protein